MEQNQGAYCSVTEVLCTALAHVFVMLGGLYCGLSTLLKRIRSSGPHLFVVVPCILCPKFSFLKVQYLVYSIQTLVLKGTGYVTLFNFVTLVLLVYTKFLSDDRG